MSHWAIEIESPIELADWLSWLVAEKLDVAVEIQDEETLTRGPQADLCRLIIRIEEQPTEKWIKSLKECLGEVGAPHSPIRTRCNTNEDWKTGWRAFFAPVEIAPQVVARPPWSDPSTGINVVVDPGMAFGTGTHATTRLAARLAHQVLYQRAPCRVLDQGSGSGVLTMMSSYLGHDTLGIELDPVAVKNAQDNLKFNQIDHPIKFICSHEIPKDPACFDVVIANIIAPVLIDLAIDIMRVCKDAIVLSGMRDTQIDDVLQVYLGWKLVEKIHEDHWVACILKPV